MAVGGKKREQMLQAQLRGMSGCGGLVSKRRSVMGKYFVGWLLGVPVFVLVIIYLVMN